MYLCASYYTIYCCLGQGFFVGIFCFSIFRCSAQFTVGYLLIFSNLLHGFALSEPVPRTIYIVPQNSGSVKTKHSLLQKECLPRYIQDSTEKQQADTTFAYPPAFLMFSIGHPYRFPTQFQTAVYRYCIQDSVNHPH